MDSPVLDHENSNHQTFKELPQHIKFRHFLICGAAVVVLLGLNTIFVF